MIDLYQQHLDSLSGFYNELGSSSSNSSLRAAYRKAIAAHLRYLISPSASILEIGCGDGTLLSLLPNNDITGIDISKVMIDQARNKLPNGTFFVQAAEYLSIDRHFDIVIVNDTFNLASDIHTILLNIHNITHERSRLIVTVQSQLWRPILSLASKLGLYHSPPIINWLSHDDLVNFANQTNWELVQKRSGVLFPAPFYGWEALINRWFSPLLQPLCLSTFFVLRPQSVRKKQLSVSVIIPARNESENIAAAVERTPEMGSWTEIIFVEGHSKDDTWERIKLVKDANPQRRIKIFQQTGQGKGNAVREGFAKAEGDILMILDADLTMPPEELPKFYTAVAFGKCDFANGSRLVYPMEKQAMQFFNICANKIFGIIFSWLLGQSIRDTLCGTKVLERCNYDEIARNRHYFGDFDPFGDFDLLFGASKLGLRITDIPIRYKERTYGTTNINRWAHGWLLIKMIFFSLKRMIFFPQNND
jgi:SAM-dependent methyltransferase